MKQLAERLVKRGHQVIIATSRLSSRDFNTLNGVRIEEFSISGNLVRGLKGDIEAYRQYILSQDFDAILVKAAQQWTFDALWPILDHIRARKVLIPCGFSGLFDAAFRGYFQEIPAILSKFDHLIFYASSYRDIDFVKRHGLKHFSIVPNGASAEEFDVPVDSSFRFRQGIGENDFLLLTVGSFTGAKGHWEVFKAFERLKLKGPATLILNGNSFGNTHKSLSTRLREAARRVLKGPVSFDAFQSEAMRFNRRNSQKKVLVTDLRRDDLVQAFKAADLFVFASRIEYSPLVLFESVAAGTPFLAGPVGNAEEIVDWTSGGIICPATRDSQGQTRIDIAALGLKITELTEQSALLRQMGEAGQKAWRNHFTWDRIAEQYERILMGECTAQDIPQAMGSQSEGQP